MWERELVMTEPVELVVGEPIELVMPVGEEWTDLLETVEEALEQWWQTAAPAVVRNAGQF